MKKDAKVEFLREKNLEKAIELIKEKGKFTILSEYSSFFDMRTYFKVNENGDINQKSYNSIILLYLFCDDEKNLAEYLFKYSYPEEKQNIKKIDRASNLDIESLKKNLMKTLVNSHLDFSKTFAKELFLRDKKAFFDLRNSLTQTAKNFGIKGFIPVVVNEKTTIPIDKIARKDIFMDVVILKDNNPVAWSIYAQNTETHYPHFFSFPSIADVGFEQSKNFKKTNASKEIKKNFFYVER